MIQAAKGERERVQISQGKRGRIQISQGEGEKDDTSFMR